MTSPCQILGVGQRIAVIKNAQMETCTLNPPNFEKANKSKLLYARWRLKMQCPCFSVHTKSKTNLSSKTACNINMYLSCYKNKNDSTVFSHYENKKKNSTFYDRTFCWNCFKLLFDINLVFSKMFPVLQNLRLHDGTPIFQSPWLQTTVSGPINSKYSLHVTITTLPWSVPLPVKVANEALPTRVFSATHELAEITMF